MMYCLKALPRLTILRRYRIGTPSVTEGFNVIEGETLKFWENDINENTHKYLIKDTKNYTEYLRHYS